jgi:hypothetical protein
MNSVSEPPIITTKPDRAPTFADVAMRLANDGPMYAAIALVGVLSIQGKASASEMVITALASLLARSWPRAVQVPQSSSSRFGIGGFLPLVVGGAILTKTLACAPPSSASSPTPATVVHVSTTTGGR